MSRTRFNACLLLLLLCSGCQRGARPALVGDPAPDFTVRDAEREISLRQFRGKVVVLNFWATWCPPCVEEMPSLLALQQKMPGRVTVLAISTDQSDSAYRAFIRDHNLSPGLLTIRDASQHSNALYGSFGFPETYIIDAGGTLRRKFIGPVDWTRPEMLDYLSRL